jgi:hypothetical protein
MIDYIMIQETKDKVQERTVTLYLSAAEIKLFSKRFGYFWLLYGENIAAGLIKEGYGNFSRVLILKLDRTLQIPG